MFELFSHYSPIERDPTIPKDEKFKHMYEWTKEVMTMFAELKLNTWEFPIMI